MHPYFTEALVGDRVAELRRAGERSYDHAPRVRSRLGGRTAVAIRRYFNHVRAAHQQPFRRPAKRAG
jgi:hypothetical protein